MNILSRLCNCFCRRRQPRMTQVAPEKTDKQVIYFLTNDGMFFSKRDLTLYDPIHVDVRDCVPIAVKLKDGSVFTHHCNWHTDVALIPAALEKFGATKNNIDQIIIMGGNITLGEKEEFKKYIGPQFKESLIKAMTEYCQDPNKVTVQAAKGNCHNLNIDGKIMSLASNNDFDSMLRDGKHAIAQFPYSITNEYGEQYSKHNLNITKSTEYNQVYTAIAISPSKEELLRKNTYYTRQQATVAHRI